MGIIGIIIGIVIIWGIIQCLFEAIEEYLGAIIIGIIGIVLLIGAFFLIKRAIMAIPAFFKGVVNMLQFLICMIPKWFIYGYCMLFICFIIIWFIVCIINLKIQIAIEMALEYEINRLCKLPVFETLNNIYSLIESDLRKYTNVLTKSRAEKMFESLKYSILKNFTKLDTGFCTRIVIDELSDVLSDMGMATDIELINEVKAKYGLVSVALSNIGDSFGDIKECCKKMENFKMIKIEKFSDASLSEVECIEKKLYISLNPNPCPGNMLPTQHFEID